LYPDISVDCRFCDDHVMTEDGGIVTNRDRMRKLTKREVDGALPAPCRYIIWDTEIRSFGLRVEPSGRKTFIARYRVGGGRTGVQRQATIGRYGTITADQARKLARRTLAAAANGEDPVGKVRSNRQPAITIAEICDWYLEQATVGRIRGRLGRIIKPSTLAMDRSRIETHVKPLLGKRAVRALASLDFEEMQSKIAVGRTARQALDIDSTRKRGGVASGGDAVAARTLGMLSTILEHAVRHRLTPHNPAKGTRKIAGRRRTLRWSLDQVRSLGDQIRKAAREGESPTGLRAIRFMLLSGFRRQEALGLERSWLFERGVNLPDSKSGPQVRPIGVAAIDVLTANVHHPSEKWVFPADRGEGHFIGVRKVLARVCGSAGLKGVTPHVLRHTFASLAGDLGYSELTIAGLLGHAGGSVTAGYVHLDATLVAAADRVSSVLAAALDGEPTAHVVPIGIASEEAA
jgi:integrase